MKKCEEEYQFIVGVDVTFEGKSLGATEVAPICDVPSWSRSKWFKHCRKTQPTSQCPAPPTHVMIQDFQTESPYRSLGLRRINSWESRQARCEPTEAVCGLSIGSDASTGENNSAINKVRIYCCDYPAHNSFIWHSELEEESETGSETDTPTGQRE